MDHTAYSILPRRCPCGGAPVRRCLGCNAGLCHACYPNAALCPFCARPMATLGEPRRTGIPNPGKRMRF